MGILDFILCRGQEKKHAYEEEGEERLAERQRVEDACRAQRLRQEELRRSERLHREHELRAERHNESRAVAVRQEELQVAVETHTKQLHAERERQEEEHRAERQLQDAEYRKEQERLEELRAEDQQRERLRGKPQRGEAQIREFRRLALLAEERTKQVRRLDDERKEQEGRLSEEQLLQQQRLDNEHRQHVQFLEEQLRNEQEAPDAGNLEDMHLRENEQGRAAQRSDDNTRLASDNAASTSVPSPALMTPPPSPLTSTHTSLPPPASSRSSLPALTPPPVAGTLPSPPVTALPSPPSTPPLSPTLPGLRLTPSPAQSTSSADCSFREERFPADITDLDTHVTERRLTERLLPDQKWQEIERLPEDTSCHGELLPAEFATDEQELHGELLPHLRGCDLENEQDRLDLPLRNDEQPLGQRLPVNLRLKLSPPKEGLPGVESLAWRCQEDDPSASRISGEACLTRQRCGREHVVTCDRESSLITLCREVAAEGYPEEDHPAQQRYEEASFVDELQGEELSPHEPCLDERVERQSLEEPPKETGLAQQPGDDALSQQDLSRGTPAQQHLVGEPREEDGLELRGRGEAFLAQSRRAVAIVQRREDPPVTQLQEAEPSKEQRSDSKRRRDKSLAEQRRLNRLAAHGREEERLAAHYQEHRQRQEEARLAQ